MSQSDRGPVVVDTGVFSARLGHRESRLTAEYRPIIEGRPAIISFVTAAEIKFGATVAEWGPSRLQRLDRELSRAEVVWPGPELVDAYAALRVVRAQWARSRAEGPRGRPLDRRNCYPPSRPTRCTRCHLR